MAKAWLAALLGLGVLADGSAARADEGVEAKAAFDRLAKLVGEWKAEATGSGEPAATIQYRLTAGGTAVMETMFPGTNHEMISVYHRDGENLLMTHYCAIGNQPRLRLDRRASRPDVLEFVFDGGTNLDPAKDGHIHSGRLRLRDDGKIEAEWDHYNQGKKAGSMKLVLGRS